MYSQEMFKTELHNKWQEIGTCPYDDHRQFARDIAELCTLDQALGLRDCGLQDDLDR